MRRTRSKYRIWRNLVAVESSDVLRQREYLKANLETVFNPDSKRRQASVPETDPIISRIISKLSRVLNGHTLQNPVVLQSLPNCKQQPWHLDYDPANTTGFGLLLALQDETRLELLEETVHLNRGDVLVFRGDVVHAGSWYEQENLRIHAYVDVEGASRRTNATYIIREF